MRIIQKPQGTLTDQSLVINLHDPKTCLLKHRPRHLRVRPNQQLRVTERIQFYGCTHGCRGSMVRCGCLYPALFGGRDSVLGVYRETVSREDHGEGVAGGFVIVGVRRVAGGCR